MTQTGLSLGTPQYMSPEQAMGERAIDARSDIYALGAVTYEMLTGEPPFTGATVQAIVAKVLTERPTAPSTVRDTVPLNVEQAVLKALAKLPADRWATTERFADALTRSETTHGVDATGVSARQVSRRGLAAVMARRDDPHRDHRGLAGSTVRQARRGVVGIHTSSPTHRASRRAPACRPTVSRSPTRATRAAPGTSTCNGSAVAIR